MKTRLWIIGFSWLGAFGVGCEHSDAHQKPGDPSAQGQALHAPSNPAGPLEAAAQHAHGNRETLEKSESCGCFQCLEQYAPQEISEWIDVVNGDGTTALCPYCGADAVLGSASGLPIDADFLTRMQTRWFR